MGRFRKFKPTRTSAEDSDTSCCTIVKVLSFYIFGCTPYRKARKARKKAPIQVRQKYLASWQREIELGTGPLTPTATQLPCARLSQSNCPENIVFKPSVVPHSRDGFSSDSMPKSKPQRISLPAKIVSRVRRAPLNPPKKYSMREENMQDCPLPNAPSLSLAQSTAEERQWMFLPPEAPEHMRRMRQRGHTWLDIEEVGIRSIGARFQNGLNTRVKVGRNPEARALWAEAERREQRSNGMEVWRVREVIELRKDGILYKTNRWELYCENKVDNFSTNGVTFGDAEKELGSFATPSKCKNVHPLPPLPPDWHTSSLSVSASVSVTARGPSPVDSISSFATPMSRDSMTTTETGSTGITIPDDPEWLKEAVTSPLPLTPQITTACAAPQSSVSSATISTTKLLLKPTLKWGDWRPRKRSVMHAGEQPDIVLIELDQGSKYISRAATLWKEWLPWPEAASQIACPKKLVEKEKGSGDIRQRVLGLARKKPKLDKGKGRVIDIVDMTLGNSRIAGLCSLSTSVVKLSQVRKVPVMCLTLDEPGPSNAKGTDEYKLKKLLENGSTPEETEEVLMLDIRKRMAIMKMNDLRYNVLSNNEAEYGVVLVR